MCLRGWDHVKDEEKGLYFNEVTKFVEPFYLMLDELNTTENTQFHHVIEVHLAKVSSSE